MARLKETESSIQNTICDYLALRNAFYWRQNTAPAFDWKTNSFRRMPKHSLRGVPDIIVVRDGQFIGLEVKSATGRQSEDQKYFEENVKKAGGAYHLVRSLDDVKKIGL